MKHDIIKTDNYLLVVDDSEIKEGDYRMNIQRGYVKLVDDAPEYYNQRNDVFKKVIAHLPLNNSPILQGVDLLPPLEQKDNYYYIDLANVTNLESFIQGYNKAKEKYKYTEEDIYKAIQYGRELHYTNDQPFIQSLSQPKIPIGFECDTEYTCCGRYLNCKGCDATAEMVNLRLKTTTTPEGHTQWAGKYIYE